MINKTDDKKVGKAINKVMKILNKYNFTIPELIIMYGNLGYHIGASMAGYEDTGPSLEDLKKAYYSNPTVDLGLMLQGLLITDWEKDFWNKPLLSTLASEQNEK